MSKPVIPAHRRAAEPPREGGSKTLAERLEEYRRAEGADAPEDKPTDSPASPAPVARPFGRAIAEKE